MILSIRMHTTLILALVLLLTFLITLLVISGTQSAYSAPYEYTAEVEDMTITVGPKPNSTNVALDTTITIDSLSSASLDELRITPEVAISSPAIEVSGPLSYKQTFYPAQLLKPATNYTVSIAIRDTPFSWSFTTTSESYQPKTSYYLAKYAPWIAFVTATIATLLVGLVIWRRKKRYS